MYRKDPGKRLNEGPKNQSKRTLKLNPQQSEQPGVNVMDLALHEQQSASNKAFFSRPDEIEQMYILARYYYSNNPRQNRRKENKVSPLLSSQASSRGTAGKESMLGTISLRLNVLASLAGLKRLVTQTLHLSLQLFDCPLILLGSCPVMKRN